MAAVVLLGALPLTAADEADTAPAPSLEEGDLAALKERIEADRGHPVLVNFWATWCLPCIHEMPLLNDIQKRGAPHGLRLLAISLDSFVYPDSDEARRKVMKVVTERSFRLPGFLYLGDEAALVEEFKVPSGLPHTILLGTGGEVLERIDGQLDPSMVERLEKLIESQPSPGKP